MDPYESKGLIQILQRDIITLYEEQNTFKNTYIHSAKHGRLKLCTQRRLCLPYVICSVIVFICE